MHEKWSAMILTGGQSTRFGSDKSQALLGGQTLLSRLLSDLPEKTEVIIVGPEFEHPSRNLKFVQENPVGGGPVAAVKAGLDLIGTEFVALIATDIPFAVQVISHLSNSLDSAKDGLIPRDGEGVPQMLCALYRTSALGNALSELGDPNGRSMRSLLALLQLTEVELPPNLKSSLLDIDTPAELQRAAATKRSKES